SAGAAIAWLLTRMRVNWRRKSQRGASFEALLSKAVKFRAEDAPALAQDAVENFKFGELLKDAAVWNAKFGKEVTAEEFYQTGAVRLVVDFPSTEGKFPEFKGQGAGIPSQPENNLIIFIGAQAMSLDYQQISLAAEKRPYMLDFRN